MPLTPIRTELKKAQAKGYAIPLYDVFEMQGTEGLFAALEEKRAPTIIALYSQFIDHPNAEAFAAYIRTKAEQSPVPVSLMLDHGASFEQCIKALSYGFTDVMYDGSKLSLEENIATTRLVVRAAHAVGAGVEAELGHVGQGESYAEFGSRREGFTDPEVVEHFVEETGVDFLAVAFGSAHGMYKGEPNLDLDLLREIRRRVDIPLVLHGGSGLSDQQFRDAIAAGISKINVATILGLTATQMMKEVAATEEGSLFTMMQAAREAYRERGAHCYDVFGTSGKA
jgi:fructose-bisphosphate aldolase class II